MSAIDVSIIIPAKDEEKRLPVFLQEVIDHCHKSSLAYEIIIVDDGSSDHTSTVALDFKKIFNNLSVIRLDKNHGKGFAVKEGLLASIGRVALFLDADGSTGPEEIEKNLTFLNQGYDIVIGSRVMVEEGKLVQTRFYRKWMGSLFNFLVHAFLIQGIKDTQCGFKMFKRPIITPLFERVGLPGFGFDLEVLFLAHQMGFKVKEVAVNWKHVDGSKINLARDSYRMLLNIFYIKKTHQGHRS